MVKCGFLKCANVKDSCDVVIVNTASLLSYKAQIMIEISYTALHTWLDKDYRSPGMLMDGFVYM